jgi:flagellar motor component MotA
MKIKAKIFYAVNSILNNKQNNNSENNNSEKNKKELSQLEELYKKTFNKETLPNINEINDFLSSLTQKEKLNFKREYVQLARKNENIQNISEIIDSEIDFHFEELFFRQ